MPSADQAIRGLAWRQAQANLGADLSEVRRFEEAISAYEQALALYWETGDEYREGIALSNLETARAAQQV
jgi:hypothetical protein